MNDMAAPSVSLEGKSLWLAQSLPVKPWQVLRAKLAVHLTLTGVPAAVCYVLLAFAHPFSAAELLLGAVLIPGYVLLMASFGLFVGLKMPNLRWTLTSWQLGAWDSGAESRSSTERFTKNSRKTGKG